MRSHRSVLRHPAAAFAGLLAMTAVLAVSGCADSGGQAPPGADMTHAGPAQSGTATPPGPLPSPSVAAGGAPGSTVTGRYLERATQDASAAPVAGGTVGLFPHAFQPGTNAMAGSTGAGGRPVATAPIGPDGRFVLTGVPSGNWFLVRTDGTATTDGRWVHVTPAEGAAVDLFGCRECPPRA